MSLKDSMQTSILYKMQFHSNASKMAECYFPPGPPPPPTLVSFTQKDKTMQNAKKPKKIVRLTLIDALMCPKT